MVGDRQEVKLDPRQALAKTSPMEVVVKMVLSMVDFFLSQKSLFVDSVVGMDPIQIAK